MSTLFIVWFSTSMCSLRLQGRGFYFLWLRINVVVASCDSWELRNFNFISPWHSETLSSSFVLGYGYVPLCVSNNRQPRPHGSGGVEHDLLCRALTLFAFLHLRKEDLAKLVGKSIFITGNVRLQISIHSGSYGATCCANYGRIFRKVFVLNSLEPFTIFCT